MRLFHFTPGNYSTAVVIPCALLLFVLLTSSACRTLDCGCPMSGESPEFNSGESHRHFHQKTGIWSSDSPRSAQSVTSGNTCDTTAFECF